MTITRGCLLLAAFAAMALTVVHLRAEQTRSAARVLKIESDWMRLRGDLWGLQARIARLRAPDRIHDRATYLATGLLPPGVREEPDDGRVDAPVISDLFAGDGVQERTKEFLRLWENDTRAR